MSPSDRISAIHALDPKSPKQGQNTSPSGNGQAHDQTAAPLDSPVNALNTTDCSQELCISQDLRPGSHKRGTSHLIETSTRCVLDIRIEPYLDVHVRDTGWIIRRWTVDHAVKIYMPAAQLQGRGQIRGLVLVFLPLPHPPLGALYSYSYSFLFLKIRKINNPPKDIYAALLLGAIIGLRM